MFSFFVLMRKQLGDVQVYHSQIFNLDLQENISALFELMNSSDTIFRIAKLSFWVLWYI